MAIAATTSSSSGWREAHPASGSLRPARWPAARKPAATRADGALDFADLAALYRLHSDQPTVKLKRQPASPAAHRAIRIYAVEQADDILKL